MMTLQSVNETQLTSSQDSSVRVFHLDAKESPLEAGLLLQRIDNRTRRLLATSQGLEDNSW
jgi:hypothetical protein